MGGEDGGRGFCGGLGGGCGLMGVMGWVVG